MQPTFGGSFIYQGNACERGKHDGKAGQELAQAEEVMPEGLNIKCQHITCLL